MKKLLACLAALMLFASVAMAEYQVETIPVESMIYLSKGTEAYYTRVEGGYQLFNAAGEPISAVYRDLTTKLSGMYYEYQGSGLNGLGLLDAQGQVMTQAAYGDFYFVDDNWVLGYVLEPTNAEAADYSNRSTGDKYMVKYTDVFYKGEKIGSLTREEYAPSNSIGAKGKYVYVRLTTDTGYWIDPNFNITRVEKDFSNSEFTYIYKKGNFHNPTQQFAYCAGCPLTPEDVSSARWFNAEKDAILDLQGNVIKSGIKLDDLRSVDDWFLFRSDDRLFGLMDSEGNEITAPIYKDIPYGYGLFVGGYQPAITSEGHLHFLDQQGQVVAKAEYELSSGDYKGFSNGSSFAVVNNMGKYIVITAEAGELPTKYEEASTPQATTKLLSVKKDGMWGAIDLKGNVVIPFVHSSALEINKQATLAFGSTEAYDKFLYRITSPEAAAPAEEEAAPAEDIVPVEDVAPADNAAAPADPDSWTCTCGAVNTGKFCPECGGARPEATPAPAADGSWTCTCGSVNTGKFCPECGTARPAAAPKCGACGYEPEGDAPKFCPECGSKF